MKTIVFVFTFLLSVSAFAETACTSSNTQTQIARNAVKMILSYAAVPVVDKFYGAATTLNNGTTLVDVLPHYADSKDWYKVVIRDSDCRIISTNLFAESLPLDTL